MKVLFVAQNFEAGGVQVALLNTLKVISQAYEDQRIDVFVFGEGEYLKEVPAGIPVLRGNLLLRLVATPFSSVLGAKNPLHILLRLFLMALVRVTGSYRLYRWLFFLQKKLTDYDLAISYFHDVPHNYFNQGTNQFVLGCVRAGKKIAWIHTDPVQAKFNQAYCQELYHGYDAIVCVSRACKAKLDQFLPEYSHKTAVVYNMFPVAELLAKAREYSPYQDLAVHKLVTVARIDNISKRIDRIIAICRRLKSEGIINFKWFVVGDGPDLAANRHNAVLQGVAELVEFAGHRPNPYPYIAGADLFVLTSAYEGYPMVVGEALLLKTPVVTTSYAAAREQVIDGVNGIIVPMSSEALYLALKGLLTRPDSLQSLKNNLSGLEFTNQESCRQWDNLVNRHLDKPGKSSRRACGRRTIYGAQYVGKSD